MFKVGQFKKSLCFRGFTATVSPVVIHKGGFCSIHQSESVLRGLVPLDGINSVGAVVVAGDDNTPKQFFGTFILEVLLALLVQHVPGKLWGVKSQHPLKMDKIGSTSV